MAYWRVTLYWSFICLLVGGAIGFAFGMGFTAMEFVNVAEDNLDTGLYVKYNTTLGEASYIYLSMARRSCELYEKHRLNVLFNRGDLDDRCKKIKNIVGNETLGMVELWTH